MENTEKKLMKTIENQWHTIENQARTIETILNAFEVITDRKGKNKAHLTVIPGARPHLSNLKDYPAKMTVV